MKKKDSKSKQSKSSKINPPDELDIKDIEEIGSKVKKEKPKKPHYVDPAKFSYLIAESYQEGIITDELAECVLKIATRLSYAPNFINYSYRDEMIGDAIVKMLHAIKNQKFDPELGNAFSYFTRIAFNAFCNRIKKEKKEKDFILNLQDSVYDDMMASGFVDQKHSIEDEQSYHYG